METGVDIEKILDDTVRDITKRLADIELKKADWAQAGTDDVASLYTVTTGSYKITVITYAETRLLRYIAEKMARRTVDEPEDVEMYSKEYFNILCGHIISKINRQTNSSARFGIPQFRRGFYVVEDCPGIVLEVSYQSDAGSIQVQSRCRGEGTESNRQNEVKGSTYA